MAMVVCITGEGEGNWFVPDILVNVRRSGEEPCIGVVKEVLLVSMLCAFVRCTCFMYMRKLM